MDKFNLLQNISQLQSCIVRTSYLKRLKAFLSVVSEQTAENTCGGFLINLWEKHSTSGVGLTYNDHNRAA